MFRSPRTRQLIKRQPLWPGLSFVGLRKREEGQDKNKFLQPKYLVTYFRTLCRGIQSLLLPEPGFFGFQFLWGFEDSYNYHSYLDDINITRNRDPMSYVSERTWVTLVAFGNRSTLRIWVRLQRTFWSLINGRLVPPLYYLYRVTFYF